MRMRVNFVGAIVYATHEVQNGERRLELPCDHELRSNTLPPFLNLGPRVD